MSSRNSIRRIASHFALLPTGIIDRPLLTLEDGRIVSVERWSPNGGDANAHETEPHSADAGGTGDADGTGSAGSAAAVPVNPTPLDKIEGAEFYSGTLMPVSCLPASLHTAVAGDITDTDGKAGVYAAKSSGTDNNGGGQGAIETGSICELAAVSGFDTERMIFDENAAAILIP
ncbi:MAG: hypothetical protein J6K28_08750 [Alistipes sp.]|nr:hypothetical protein [Alistipes sp.]